MDAEGLPLVGALVELGPVDAGRLHRVPQRRRSRVGAHAVEDVDAPGVELAPHAERPRHVVAEGPLARGVGLVLVEADIAALQVDGVPRQPQGLAFAQPLARHEAPEEAHHHRLGAGHELGLLFGVEEAEGLAAAARREPASGDGAHGDELAGVDRQREDAAHDLGVLLHGVRAQLAVEVVEGVVHVVDGDGVEGEATERGVELREAVLVVLRRGLQLHPLRVLPVELAAGPLQPELLERDLTRGPGAVLVVPGHELRDHGAHRLHVGGVRGAGQDGVGEVEPVGLPQLGHDARHLGGAGAGRRLRRARGELEGRAPVLVDGDARVPAAVAEPHLSYSSSRHYDLPSAAPESPCLNSLGPTKNDSPSPRELAGTPSISTG